MINMTLSVDIVRSEFVLSFCNFYLLKRGLLHYLNSPQLNRFLLFFIKSVVKVYLQLKYL